MKMSYALGVLLVLVGSCLAFDPSKYTTSQVLLPEYTVYWRADVPNSMLYLALQVKTTGWVGFGLAEDSSGSMAGSDIVTGYVKAGKGYITDRWASTMDLPQEDSCQDWVLVSAEETGGVTTLEIKRAFDTSDAQDRAIHPGPNRVVCSFSKDGSDEISYHGPNRITSVIEFYGSSPLPVLTNNTKSFELRVPNFTLPNNSTVYVCTSFLAPVNLSNLYHIIQIDPLVNPANKEHVHHYLAHICQDNGPKGYVQKFQKSGVCSSPVGNTGSGCIGLTAAWAAGGGSTVLPAEAGFPMGGNDTNNIHYIVLEMHYNNPGAKGGYVDDSGVRFWYTNELRPHDAAMLTLGDPAVRLPAIAPGIVKEYETECPSACTSKVPNDINVFQSFPHMHEVGSQIWTTQWRGDQQIAEWGRIEYWSFDHQQSQPVNFTLKPGDRLNTHCIYDTTKKTDPTPFGTATTDEMCMHFLSYYPRSSAATSPFAYCGYVDTTVTICGGLPNGIMAYGNPTVRDPPGGGNRTFGVTPAVCKTTSTQSSGASFIYVTPFIVYLLILLL